MNRLRWALARLLAPERIIRDPFPEEEGVFVYYQSDPVKPHRLQWVVKAERFRMKATTRLPSLDGSDDFSYQPSGSFVRFVGTAGHS